VSVIEANLGFATAQARQTEQEQTAAKRDKARGFWNPTHAANASSKFGKRIADTKDILDGQRIWGWKSGRGGPAPRTDICEPPIEPIPNGPKKLIITPPPTVGGPSPSLD
jgi:hypothetical protein